jgi:DNA-binding transcriptional LysR family regulator
MENGTPHPFPTSAEAQLALVLWLVWGPAPSPPDGYVLYAEPLLELLRAGVADRDLADALGQLRAEQLEMPPDIEADLRAARSVWEWYFWFLGEDRPVNPGWW